MRGGTFFLYAVRRLLLLLPFLLGLTFLSFSLGVAAPGDPALAVLTLDGNTEPSDAEWEAMRCEMGLDRPLGEQYLRWLWRAVQGDLGNSYLTGQPVLAEMTRRFPVTLMLSLAAMVWVVGLGVPLGVWAARREGSRAEVGLRLAGLFFISVPGFWLAILSILLFSEELRLVPSSGFSSLRHLILPSFVLGIGAAATVARVQQTALRDIMGKAFLLTERAKGLTEGYIFWHHALPNALAPALTMMGTFFGGILGGSVIVEEIFSIPGLGSYILAAIWGRDYPVIQGYVIFAGTVFLLFNYLVDLLCRALNPALTREEVFR